MHLSSMLLNQGFFIIEWIDNAFSDFTNYFSSVIIQARNERDLAKSSFHLIIA